MERANMANVTGAGEYGGLQEVSIKTSYRDKKVKTKKPAAGHHDMGTSPMVTNLSGSDINIRSQEVLLVQSNTRRQQHQLQGELGGGKN